MEITTMTIKTGKFDARFYHLVYEEEIGRVKGHFGPINSLRFHPDGKRYIQHSVHCKKMNGCFDQQVWLLQLQQIPL